MNKELAVLTEELMKEAEESFSKGQLEVIRRTIAKDASPDEFFLFVATANRLGLDPFAGQLTAVRFEKDAPLTSYATWEGLVARADQTGQYQGIDGPYFTADGKEWTEVFIPRDGHPYPFAAKVGVFRKGFRQPVWGLATWSSWARKVWDSNKREFRLMKNWAQMPDVMLSKQALRVALKRAFPFHMPGAEGWPEPPDDGEVHPEPISRALIVALHALASQMNWTDEEKHARAGVESLNDLTAEEGMAMFEEWAEEIEAAKILEKPAETEPEIVWDEGEQFPREVGVEEVPEPVESDAEPRELVFLHGLPPDAVKSILAKFGDRTTLADAFIRSFVKRKNKQASEELDEAEIVELVKEVG